MQARIDDATEVAKSSDLNAVMALLHECELTSRGVEQCLHNAVLVRSGTGIAAVAAFESHTDLGLLRSVAVAPGHRGRGLARTLTRACEARASKAGLHSMYLLTETAEPMFALLGYERIERDSVPAPIRASEEFASLCPQSAAVMMRDLG